MRANHAAVLIFMTGHHCLALFRFTYYIYCMMGILTQTMASACVTHLNQIKYIFWLK